MENVNQNKFKWGFKFVKGPFKECGCPSHIEAGEYPVSDFASGLVFLTEDEALGDLDAHLPGNK